MKAFSAATRKRELMLIHIAKSALGMSDDDYRTLIGGATKTTKTSAGELTDQERHTLLRHLKGLGFKVKPKAGKPAALREPQVRKLRAMWYALADVQAVERPGDAAACDKAIETWAKRQLAGSKVGALDALRFATGAQLNRLIEEMKAWGARVKAEVH